MNANQIKNMTGDECFKALDLIEGRAKMTGKDLTAAQKKTVKAIEARICEITEPFVED